MLTEKLKVMESPMRVFQLDVGGEVIKVTRETLMSVEGSKLANLFQDES